MSAIAVQEESQELSKSKKQRKSLYSDKVKAKAVKLYNQGVSVIKISEKLKLKAPSVYSWIQAARKASAHKSNENEVHPAVHKVINSIRKEQAGGEAHSLASDFGINENAENREAINPVELKFCPCCGTNIKAVMIALQTCQEIK